MKSVDESLLFLLTIGFVQVGARLTVDGSCFALVMLALALRKYGPSVGKPVRPSVEKRCGCAEHLRNILGARTEQREGEGNQDRDGEHQ